MKKTLPFLSFSLSFSLSFFFSLSLFLYILCPNRGSHGYPGDPFKYAPVPNRPRLSCRVSGLVFLDKKLSIEERKVLT